MNTHIPPKTAVKIVRSRVGTIAANRAGPAHSSHSFHARNLAARRTWREYRSWLAALSLAVLLTTAGPVLVGGTVVEWGTGQIPPPAGLVGVVAIAAGEYHSLALKNDGTVVGWGYNFDLEATPPAGLSGVVAIAAGELHSLALKNDGTVVGWGDDQFGQASPPAGLAGVVAISACVEHSLALKDDGTVVGWGRNYYGQATPPPGLSGVVAICAGGVHSLALKNDGTVVGWGWNDYGQCTPPAGLSGVLAIAAGYDYSLALRDDGTVIGWGYNWAGQITPPADLSDVTAIAAGVWDSFALKSDGTVIGWGRNNSGQSTPPAGLAGVVAIAAGADYAMALVGGESGTILLFSENSLVPGAGISGSGIPAGALWCDFSIPSISDAGTVAFIGKWKSPAENGAAIVVDGALAVKTGDPVPWIRGAIWKSFEDPVVAADGHIAFLAALGGRGVAKGNDTVVSRMESSGLPVILARTGNNAPGTGGARFSEFTALSIDGPSVVFTAKLAKGAGPPKVTPSNDAGIWASDPANLLALVVRQGQPIWLSTGPPTHLQGFDFLTENNGSPGMSRGEHAWDGTNTNVCFRAALADGRGAQMWVMPGGVPVAYAESGAGVGRPSLGGATFKSFGLPASDHARTLMAFHATLTKGSGGITPANAQGIFLFNPATSLFDCLARLTDPAPGTGEVFSALDDPVMAADGSGLAWVGQVKGGKGVKGNVGGIWWQPTGEASVLVAREGEEPPGAPDAKWKSFDALALPVAGHGPIFVASLVAGSKHVPGPGGVTPETNQGVWALDSTDTLQLLFRSGVTQIDGQTVKTFTVLQAVKGTPGVTRSFNTSATIVWHATFTDGSSSIVITSVP